MHGQGNVKFPKIFFMGVCGGESGTGADLAVVTGN